MRKISNLLYICILAIAFCSCNKHYDGQLNINTVKYNKNSASYPQTKMDSVQAISKITRQKIQELLDLSTLYASGNKDTEIDSVIYAQIQTYFLNPDSTKIKPLIRQLDSLKAHYAKVNDLKVTQHSSAKDTFNLVNFKMDYFDANKKYLGSMDKTAQYVLKKSPVKFVQEFKFYFVNFDFKPKDTISSGKISASKATSEGKTSVTSSHGGK